jgi:uncharacterized lipoprotein YddW (UPF0748 family)
MTKPLLCIPIQLLKRYPLVLPISKRVKRALDSRISSMARSVMKARAPTSFNIIFDGGPFSAVSVCRRENLKARDDKIIAMVLSPTPNLRRVLLPFLVYFPCVFFGFKPCAAQEIQPALKPREGEVRAVWIHTYAPFDWDVEMKHLAEAGFNCVFVRAARGANAIYPSQILPPDEWAENLKHDELQKAVSAAHHYGLEFHVWMVCFHVGGAAKQNGKAKKLYNQMAADDLLVRDLNGAQAPFLNPADPRNQEWELSIARELVEKYDVDGLHLDYIRYPDEPHFDFDYGEVSRREFEEFFKVKVENWPTDVYSGALKWYYENWERANINDLVQRVYRQTKQLKPQVKVSAAVWRARLHNRATIKQDWLLWANQGWLDFAVPMDYTGDDAQFRDDVSTQVSDASGKILLVAGIGAYQHKDASATLRQIQIARASGADGYALFDYKPEKYEALLAALKAGAQSKSTFLPFRGPRVVWNAAPGLVRKNAPSLYPSGKTVRVTITALPFPGMQEILGAVARLETLDGRWMTAPGRIETVVWPAPGWSPQVFSFIAPPGKMRVALSGVVQNKDGSFARFIARGPVMEAVEAGEFVAQSARLTAPKNDGEVVASFGRRVAVYEGGQAASGVLRAFEQTRNRGVKAWNVVAVSGLEREFWQSAQVLVLAQLRDVSQLTPEVMGSLREWVSQGGTLILTHDAVGFRWHGRIFPEMGQGVALSKNRNLEIVPNEFGISIGAWQHEYSDHVVLQAGKEGAVLAHEAGDATKPILIGGKFGRGKVFLYGALLGYAPDGNLNDGERTLLMEMCK